jgi:hypothetical protein
MAMEFLPFPISGDMVGNLHHVRFEDFMTVTKRNVFIWDVTLFGSCKT